MGGAAELRATKAKMITELKALMASQTPLKWVDRVIMWCASKMPSFTDGVEGSNADQIVDKARAKASDVAESAKARQALITKYGK